MAPLSAAMDTFRCSKVRGWVGGECRYKNWNTTTKTGVNEVVQPWKCTPLGSVWCFSNKIGHRLLLSLPAQPDHM